MHLRYKWVENIGRTRASRRSRVCRALERGTSAQPSSAMRIAAAQARCILHESSGHLRRVTYGSKRLDGADVPNSTLPDCGTAVAPVAMPLPTGT